MVAAQSQAEDPENSVTTTVGLFAVGDQVISSAEAQREYRALQNRALRLKFQALRQGAALSLIAELLDAAQLEQALIALVNTLHLNFRCSRVAVALIENDELHIKAISQQTSFDPRTREIQKLLAPMQASIDADRLLHYVGNDEGLHESFEDWLQGDARRQGLTLALIDNEKPIGALLLEAQDRPRFSASTEEILLQLAALSAPILAIRQRADMPFRLAAREKLEQTVATLLSPEHLAPKVLAIVATVVLVPALLLPFNYSVSAEAQLVASERRLLAAPRAGYIEQVHATVGDEVKAGDALLHLDTRELELEQDRWQNELASLDAELRAALADADRAAVAELGSRQRQMQAELALVQQRLERSTLRAPIDGVIVSGELEQALGAPVERGKSLLEIAPGEDYSLYLLVDETDVQRIAPGQSGQLSLTANPGDEIAFAVDAIHPLAEPAEGRNRFRVEATLLTPPQSLRPGQTGVAQVEVGKASRAWLWTRRFGGWLRQRLWEWGW